jgi:ring-1,2-phenylacetyl-CoA epoxidase subunit PaaC
VTDGATRDGLGPDPESLRAPWATHVERVLDEATLERPQTTWAPRGGRAGLHSERFGFMLAEMQHLHRAHPGAHW